MERVLLERVAFPVFGACSAMSDPTVSLAEELLCFGSCPRMQADRGEPEADFVVWLADVLVHGLPREKVAAVLRAAAPAARCSGSSSSAATQAVKRVLDLLLK